MRAVSFSEWLRPWNGLGLDYILSESPLALSGNLQDSEQEQNFQKQSHEQFRKKSHEQAHEQVYEQAHEQSNEQAHERYQKSAHNFIPDSCQNSENSENSESSESSGKDTGTSCLENREPPPRYSSHKAALSGQEPDKTKRSSQPAQAGSTSAGTTSAGPTPAGSTQAFYDSAARPLNSDPLRKRIDPPELKDTEWPSSYTKIFQKLNPAPALWTYRDLGYDLSGNSEVQRSEFLKEIIGLLDFPRGTSLFWPYSLPVDGQLEDNFPVFYQGIKKLRPKIIIVIGQSGMKPFNDVLPLSTPFTQGVFMGKLLILLPEFSQFYNSESLVQRAAGYLRGVLSGMKLF